LRHPQLQQKKSIWKWNKTNFFLSNFLNNYFSYRIRKYFCE
jgi:hypothetical protein